LRPNKPFTWHDNLGPITFGTLGQSARSNAIGNRLRFFHGVDVRLEIASHRSSSKAGGEVFGVGGLPSDSSRAIVAG